jgi:hypothetical protein
MSFNCLKRLNYGKKLGLKWLELDKSLFTFTKKKREPKLVYGCRTWPNLHNTTKPVILNALLNFSKKYLLLVEILVLFQILKQ